MRNNPGQSEPADPPRTTSAQQQSSPVCYRIDANDRVVGTSEAWSAFAAANGGDDPQPARIMNRTVWDFISDATVRDLYRRIVGRAREGRPLQFRYRCDSPAKRRVFEMTVSAQPDASVEFCSRLILELSRPPIALLAPRRAPVAPAPLLRICSWCHAIAWPGESWAPLESAVERVQLLDPERLPRLTHGICPDCARKMFGLLEKR